MEENLSECLVLKRLLGRDLPCQICTHKDFPSYYEGGRGEGCWTAHTALCILEALSIKGLISEVLYKKGVKWETLLLAVLLHDSGKLSENYISSKGVGMHHNEASAQIAYEVLRRLRNEVGISDADLYTISQACFLHMEYYVWRSMVRSYYTSSAQTTSPGVAVRLAESVRRPLTNLEKILEVIGIADETILKVLMIIPELPELRLQPSVYTPGTHLPRECLRRSVALQWFILLIDNRAGSARSGVEAYWRTRLRELLCKYGELRAERIIELSLEALEKLRGMLTPIPGL